jgi:hypothetical protein
MEAVMLRNLLPSVVLAFFFLLGPAHSYPTPAKAWRYDTNGDGRIPAEVLFALPLLPGSNLSAYG